MVNLLIKAEILIDNILLKLGSAFVYFFKLLIPNALRNKFFYIEEKIESWLQQKKEKIKARKELLLKRVNELRNQANEKIEQARGFDYKAKIQDSRIQLMALTQRLKVLLKEKSPTALMSLLLAQILIPIKRLKGASSSLSPNQILAGVIGSAILGLSGLGIFFEGRKIVSTTEQYRTPAGEIEEGELEQNSKGATGRPRYYKKETKQLQLTHVKMPVYYNDVNQLHTLDIDFSLQMDSRFATKFIDEYEHELRDHLLLSIEPILPEFPLEEEGKIILRDKILYETNKFLQEKETEGQVEEVKIIYILGT